MMSRSALLKGLTQRASSSTVAGRMSYSTKRTFPSFVKYGTHSAFQVQPVAPVYSPVSGRDYLKTKRLGSMMLSWAGANEPGKSYSYNDKVFFSLSPTEIGLVLEVLDGKLAEVTLTHSPNVNAKAATEKTRRSLLDVKRVAGPDGHPQTEFNVVTSDNNKEEVEEKVALNAGEARVLKELLTYALPRLYGFHSALEGSPVVEGNDGNDNWTGGNNNYNNSGGGGGRYKPQSSSGGGAAPEWPF